MKWEESAMTREEKENELSTCQRIKALSCHIPAPTHSSSQCLKLMSQVSLSSFCNTPASSHSHYRFAVRGDNLSPWTVFLFPFNSSTAPKPLASRVFVHFFLAKRKPYLKQRKFQLVCAISSFYYTWEIKIHVLSA